MIQAGTTFSQDVPPYIIVSKKGTYGGVNVTVGRQQGVDEKVLKHIANAYRLVFNGNGSLLDAIIQIEEQVPPGREIDHIVEFLKTTEIGILSKTIH